MNAAQKFKINRAQSALLHLVASAAQSQFKGLVGADMRIRPGKYLGQLGKPTGNQRQRGRVTRRQNRPVRRLAQRGKLVEFEQVVQVTCKDWQKAFAVLDGEGLIVQVQGDRLRVPASPDQVKALLDKNSLEGSVTTVQANLEEAFVRVVSGASS